MPRRFLIWLALVPVILAVLAAILVFMLLRTPPGQRAVLNAVLPRIAADTGVSIEIGGVGGAWPSELRLRDVRLKDQDGVWFEATRITVIWQPSAALSGRYIIDAASIAGGHLLRAPNIPGGPRKPGPRHYPYLYVGGINAPGFQIDEPVLDQALALDLKGSVELRTDGSVRAPIDIHLATAGLVDGKLAAILGAKAHLATLITGSAGKVYSFETFNAESADAAIKLAGRGSYEVATREISAALQGPLVPKVASEIDPALHLTSPGKVAIIGKGPWRNLALTLVADLGPLTYDGKNVPGSRTEANLVLAHRRLEGPVRIAFQDAGPDTSASTVNGVFFWDRKSAIKLSDLKADYRGAHITGDVAFDTHAKTMHAALDADVKDLGVLPLPFEVRGPVKGKGLIDLGAATNVDVDLKSPLIFIEGTKLDEFVASAKGRLEDAKVEITARSASRGGLGSASAISVAGSFARNDKRILVSIDRLSAEIGKQAARLAAPTTLTIAGKDLTLGPTDLRWGDKGRITARGSFDNEIVANLTVEGIEMPKAPVIASGQASIDTRQAETGRLSLKLVPIKGQGPELRSDIEGLWRGGRLNVTGAIEGFGADAAFARIEPVTFSMPLVLDRRNGKIALKTEGPIDGRVRYKGAIDRFLLLAPIAEQKLKGQADFDIAASGTLKDPRFAGRASLHDGTYENVADGILLDKLNVDGQVEHPGNNYVLSVVVSASDGRGAAAPIRAKGQVQLGAKPHVDASLQLSDARVVHTQTMTLVATGDVKLEGTLPALTATGTVNVQSFEFQIPNELPPSIVHVKVVLVDEHGKPIAPEETVKRPPTVAVALNIAIGARQQINIRGRGLDSEWSANLRVTGTESDPRLDGDLTLRRGRFDFAGRQFTLTSGGTVHFVPSRTTDPDLNVEARNQLTNGTTAIINITGKSSRPDIKLSSDPPLPADDVMSLVLFGRSADQLSALQAVQMANAIATLTGDNPLAKGPGILDRARTSLGLDLLDFSIGPEGGGVTLGKYLSRGVFVSASPGIGGKAGSVSAKIDVSHSLNVETSVGQDAEESVGIQWKHDY